MTDCLKLSPPFGTSRSSHEHSLTPRNGMIERYIDALDHESRVVVVLSPAVCALRTPPGFFIFRRFWHLLLWRILPVRLHVTHPIELCIQVSQQDDFGTSFVREVDRRLLWIGCLVERNTPWSFGELKIGWGAVHPRPMQLTFRSEGTSPTRMR